MNKRFDVTFYTTGGREIQAVMEFPDRDSIIDFVDSQDYIIVSANGADHVIPREKIDSFNAQEAKA